MNEIRKQQLEQIANNDYLLDAKPTPSCDGRVGKTHCVDELDEAIRILGKQRVDKHFKDFKLYKTKLCNNIVLYGTAGDGVTPK